MTESNVIAVVGAGTMGIGIAQTYAQAGFEVLLVDEFEDALLRAPGAIEVNLRQLDEFGLVAGSVQENLGRITTLQGATNLLETDNLLMVVESISEDLSLKRELFALLDGLPESVVIATNTSSLTLSAITDGMQSAHRTVGLHYFNPAHIIPAVEVHRCAATTDEAIALARQLVERTAKNTILVRKELPGFVINRLTGSIEREIDYLLDEGVVTPHDLDKAVKASFGFRLACLGPMEAEDMIGLDIAARVSGNIFKVLSNATKPSPVLVEKVNQGELGVKSGLGWYDYPEDEKQAILAGRNARLLRQLALFQDESNDKGDQS